MSVPLPRRLALAVLLGALIVPGRQAAADWLPEEVPASSRFT